MSETGSHNKALDQLRSIERAVVDGDLLGASEQARQLIPLLQVDDYRDALALQAKVDALKASVHTSRQRLALRLAGAQQGRRGCNTYQKIQTNES